MLRVLDDSADREGGLGRREVLRVGALGIGLGLPALLSARASASAARGAPAGFGAAKSCILLYLVGGPPQHETWDPKPEASVDIRGPFAAIPTTTDGLQVGELMPLLARQAARYSVIRSVVTNVNAHTGSGYWMLTGHPHLNRDGESTPPAPDDWPHLGAVVRRTLPGRRHLPAAITIPEALKNNPGIVVAGQNSGFLPEEYSPLRLECDPSAPDFEVPGLTPLRELPLSRLGRRNNLLARVNGPLDRAVSDAALSRQDTIFQQAFDLLTSADTRRAFDLGSETRAVRESYGSHKFGQSCLLARRLVEAGARLVTVNWPREPGDLSVGNPLWDTHSDNAGRLKNNLMPPMDRAVSALLDDLDARGLLDETLVVWMGEFGRTPKFNPGGGRDHWGQVFSMMLAGGGVRGGRVYGESDAQGAFPKSDAVTPEQVHATIHHCLGIPPGTEIRDRLGRPFPLVEGEPLAALF